MDSDGCVLDTMEPKHRRCFTPALIKVWGLEEIESLACDGFLAINLYSNHRGVNRFMALHLFWRWLADRAPKGFLAHALPPPDRFNDWVRRGGPLSEATLAAELARSPADIGLGRTLRWSRLVNQLSQSLPPVRAFGGAPEALANAASLSALHVVSGGNGATIREEWHAAGLDRFVCEFHTQEAGSKEAILRGLAARPGAGVGLMVGDSPGDADAAQAAGSLFFPIIPGREEESWRMFRHAVLPSFLTGRYTAADSDDRTATFRAALARPAGHPALLP